MKASEATGYIVRVTQFGTGYAALVPDAALFIDDDEGRVDAVAMVIQRHLDRLSDAWTADGDAVLSAILSILSDAELPPMTSLVLARFGIVEYFERPEYWYNR